MKKNILTITVLFTILIIACALGVGHHLLSDYHQDMKGEELVLLNEINQLTKDQDGKNPAAEQIERLANSLKGQSSDFSQNNAIKYIILITLLSLCFLALLSTYLYMKVLRPFHKLEKYAHQLAKGNFDLDLKYERSHFFGAFTWAFDHMRTEIMRTRNSEKEAVAKNKTIIATLSHDIKTPISSIRAYAEGLEANLNSSPERRRRYLQVIMKKCDEVTDLTNDLVLHSLTDLGRLQIGRAPVAIDELVRQIINDLEYQDMIQVGQLYPRQLMIDKRRMEQVLENLFNNARKYGRSPVKLFSKICDQRYYIHIKDAGDGINPEDLPFIFDKFYRGQNVQEQSGSGLGLYIVKYIMNQMGGDISLYNQTDGLEVVLWIPL